MSNTNTYMSMISDRFEDSPAFAPLYTSPRRFYRIVRPSPFLSSSHDGLGGSLYGAQRGSAPPKGSERAGEISLGDDELGFEEATGKLGWKTN